MITYPNIDPVALDLGFAKIHWYGITYLVAFAGSWLLLNYRVKLYQGSDRAPFLTPKFIEDLLFFGALGVILGGRLGYTLFYNFDNFIADPLTLMRIWQGGMSFHGGLLGVTLSLWWFAKKNKISFLALMDEVAIVVPFGLACGRMGNFINAELWGRATDVPWAMVFPTDPLGLPRHPSMLYEFFLEGVVLFIILWLYARKPRPKMAVASLFVLGYGLFRFAVEFVRQPDLHMGESGFIFGGWLTQGMILSLPMVLIGLFLFVWSYKGIKHTNQ